MSHRAGGSDIDGPQKPEYEREAPTLVVEKGASGAPGAGLNPTGARGPGASAAIPDESSSAPTLAADAGPFSPGSTRPGARVRTAADAEAALQPGAVFASRYRIVSLLGQGGMGAVYKAQDLDLDRVVALKTVRPELSGNPEILQRFKQELILARQVTDRNIIRIFDLGQADGMNFITMEYIEGQTLHQLLKERGKLAVGDAVEIMEQVAAGLAAVHREGVIHRDLKPGNIMRNANGRVVIMDFGLARTVSGEGMTQTGAMLGTIEYMSPEQAQGKELKPSSDIFTLGLILYELLSGATPFQAESAIASLILRTQQRATPLADVDKKIPDSLSNLVAKCLEKDPAKRYQSAEELDADLRAWQGRSAATRLSPSSSAALRMSRIRELPWPLLAMAAVLVLAIATGAAWFVGHRHQAAKAGPHAPVSVLVADFANRTGDPVLDNTLEPMLGLALEGASFINTYSREDARKLAEKLPRPSDQLNEQSARLVAVNQGVAAVITGAIEKRGSGYDISAKALDAVTGKVLAKADVRVANKQAIVGSLPELAAPLRQALGDSTPASVQFNQVSGGFTAASLEAVHEDALGVDEQFAGKFQEAFDSFQRAAQLDPDFARAYTGMAAMAQNLGRPEDAVKYMKLAMQHEDRMTERERYRDRGLYYLTTGDWQNCVQEYTQLVARYPADRVGQNNLATCYTQLRDGPKALDAARDAVQIVPKGVGQRLNLAFISAFAGDFASSENDAHIALSLNPSAAQAYLVLAEAQLGEGRLDEAAASYRKLGSFGPLAQSTAIAGLADLAAYQGKYADAEHTLEQGAAADVAAKMTDSAARKYMALSDLDEMEGKSGSALSNADTALSLNQSTPIEFLAASTYADAGAFAKAERLAAKLSSALSSESQAYGRIVNGMIALKRKDTNQAIRQITGANRLLDTWIGHFDLGQAYLAAGAFPQADSEFDECTKRRGEAIELFMDNVPTYADFPPVYYYQGRARQAMNSAGFSQFYKSYLSIRGQSPDDPLAADARRRIGQ
jgi:Flp pilus assembly protein TadD/predicted Ser/Thr protein kinase